MRWREQRRYSAASGMVMYGDGGGGAASLRVAGDTASVSGDALTLTLPPELVEAIAQRAAEILRDERDRGERPPGRGSG
jgi:hypothetical protein